MLRCGLVIYDNGVVGGEWFVTDPGRLGDLVYPPSRTTYHAPRRFGSYFPYTPIPYQQGFVLQVAMMTLTRYRIVSRGVTWTMG